MAWIGSTWFGERERRVIAWGVTAGPDQRARVHIRVNRQKADLIQAMRLKLVVQLLLGESHCLAIYDSLA